MAKLTLAMATMLVLALGARAQEPAPEDGRIRIHGSYISGLQYLDMNGLEKKAYVAGVVEGMLLAPAFGADEAGMVWFHECTRAIGLKELRKYLFEYIKERDALWQHRNPAQIFRAIHEACEEKARESEAEPTSE